jgi:hypothetical protein
MTFVYQDNGGFLGNANNRVHCANNKFFDMRQSGRSRISSNGTTWTTASGLTNDTALETVIYTGDEYIAFRAGGNPYVSTDGLNWSGRTLSFTPQSGRAAKVGDSIAITATTGNTIGLSTDKGVTWTTQSMGGTSLLGNTFLIAASNRFILFARNEMTITNFIKWSTTGAAGTWTEVALPTDGDDAYIDHAIYHAGIGRIIAVARDGVSYYSDNLGDTWSVGATVQQHQFSSGGTQHMVYSALNGKVYYRTAFHNGDYSIDEYRVYSTADGTSPWVQHFASPTGDGGIGNLAVWDTP